MKSEQVEAIMLALASAMAISQTEQTVEDYLAGRSVLTAIGRRGVWHFDHMMRTIGCEPPVPVPTGGTPP